MSISVTGVLGFAVLLAYDYYDNMYGRWYRKDKYITDFIELHGFKDYTYRIYNHKTCKYTTPRIGWVSGFSKNDSLAVYSIARKRGYINAYTGKIVIDAENNAYSKAWVFSEGMAAVMKNGKIGFINKQNEVVIPFQFKTSDVYMTGDPGYVFHDGYCLMTDTDGIGIIDTTGRWVIEPVYEEIHATNENGYKVMMKEGMSGILDPQCRVLYPSEYIYADITSGGITLAKDGKMWQVDFDGWVTKPFLYDFSYYLNYPVGYDLNGEIKYEFSEYGKYEIMNLFGIMNRTTGKLVTPALYSEINMLAKDLFEVMDPETHTWYTLDTEGNRVSSK